MLRLGRGRLNTLKDTVMSTEILIKANVKEACLREALLMAQRFEGMLSAYRENSWVSKINKHAGLYPVRCPPEVVELISLSLDMARRTGGLFDPTVGVLIHGLFGFGTGNERIPTAREVEEVIPLVDYRKVKVEGEEVFLQREGMRIDLGGIAKGWTAQKLAEFLIDKGASEVLVSVGGEICTFGRRWKIAVKDALGKGYMGVLETMEDRTTISTSGSYERFIKDRKHHHILNPVTGAQRNEYAGITLVERGFKGAELDALATACFNAPYEMLGSFTDSYLLQTSGGEIRIGKALLNKVKACLIGGNL